ncbi:MAG: PilZ domain-containing protein, partial [Myxococcota bacterium]
QEERGTSSEAPLIAVWDPSRGNGGGDPFSYGLLRHLITPKVFESPDRFSAIMRTFEDGATDVRRQVSDEQGETYRARLVDAKARTSFEAAIANDLTKLDVESYASARVIKALVALTSLVGDEHSLSWPVQARFGASTDRVWLQLVSGATLSPEQLLSEFSRGYLGAFKDRERSRVGAMGWFFAFRQVDGMYVGLSSDRTEVLVSWEREPVGWTWKPALHICVAGRQNWRRARRYSVDWRGELNATERRIDAKVLNLSSLGAFVEVAPHAQFETSERVQLELEMPWGGADYAELITLDGAVRYVDPASDGIAIEFHSEARGLGHALERLQLAG